MEQVFRVLRENIMDDKKSVLPIHFGWSRKNDSRVGDWLIIPHNKVFSLDATERKFRFHIDPKEVFTVDAKPVRFGFMLLGALRDTINPHMKSHF